MADKSNEKTKEKEKKDLLDDIDDGDLILEKEWADTHGRSVLPIENRTYQLKMQ